MNLFESVKNWTTKFNGPQPAKEFSNAPLYELSSEARDEAIKFLMSIPEISEAWSQAEIELAIDDRGWITSMGQYTGEAIDEKQRHLEIVQSRAYYRRDPLAKQAVRLWTNYTLGATGVCYEVEDAEPDTEDPMTDPTTEEPGTGAPPPAPPTEAEYEDQPDPEEPDPLDGEPAAPNPIKEKLDAFFNHPLNKRILNAQGQQRSSNKLLIDGDVFFAIFDKEPVKQIRRIEALQIIKVITDPDDEEHVLGYKRRLGSGKEIYYQDWTSKWDDEIPPSVEDPDTKKPITWEKDVVVYQASFDQIGRFGCGLLVPALDWTKENRRLHQARVSIVQALARFAWKYKAKGGQGALNAVKTRIESSIATSGTAAGREQNPASAAGSSFIGNDGLDVTPFPRSTGAGDAKTDTDVTKLMVCAATGIMLHYFGDPSTGNLATATAMELPMLKQFEGNQQLWRDCYRDIASIVLDEDPAAPIDSLMMTLPPILDEELGQLGPFLTALVGAFPEAKVDQVLALCLKYLGLDDVDEVLEAVKKKKVEVEQQRKEQLDALAKQPQLTQPNDPMKPAPAVEALVEVLRDLNHKLK